MAFARNDADFIGAVIESCLYGIYCIVFWSYMRYNTRERNHRKYEPIHIILVALFVLTTCDIVLDLTQQFYVVARGREDHFLGVINATTTVFLFLLDFMSQIILIYRCWNVWSRNPLVAIIPGFFSVGAFACGMAVSVQVAKQTARHVKRPGWLYPVGAFAFGTSCLVNAIVTCLMIGRIWKVYSEVKNYVYEDDDEESRKRPSLPWVVSILLEGAVVIFLMQVAVTVLFTTKHAAYNIVGGPIFVAYGLNATAMIVRVYSNTSYETYATGRRSTTLSFAAHKTMTSTREKTTGHSTTIGDSQSVETEPTRVNGV